MKELLQSELKFNSDSAAHIQQVSPTCPKPIVSGSFCRITQSQINSIISAKDDMKAMLGCGDDDTMWRKHIKNIEKFISNNRLSYK